MLTDLNGHFITKCPPAKARGYSPRFASRKSTRSAALQAGNTNNTLLRARELQQSINQYGLLAPVPFVPRVIVRKRRSA